MKQKRNLYIRYENPIYDEDRVVKRDLVLRDDEDEKVWSCHTWANERSEEMADIMMIKFLDSIEEGVNLRDQDDHPVTFGVVRWSEEVAK